MKKRISILMMLLVMVASVAIAKPKVRIIATGGTIAGVSTAATSSAYTAGQVGIETLINAVPEIKDLADVTGEQLCNIGSQDMNDAVWLKLAETAYFLSLTVHSDKPVVLAGAMRPSTAISADGPANLYNGVATLVDPSSKGRGVMVSMNNSLFSAKAVYKGHTTDLDTFKGGVFGAMGYIYNGKPIYVDNIPSYKFGLNSEFNVTADTKLPKVGIVYGYANASPIPMQALVDAGFDGIVLAGVGDGNFYQDVFEVAVKAQEKGVQIVRSSRVPTGATNQDAEVDDAKYHFVASLNLNPQKARILLMLALTKTHDWQEIQKYFAEY